MNFVTDNFLRLTCRQQAAPAQHFPPGLPGSFFGFKNGRNIQQTQTGSLAAPRFNLAGIANFFAQHLKPSADPDHRDSFGGQPQDFPVPPVFLNLGQIMDGIFAAGNNQEIRPADFLPGANIPEANIRFFLQGIKIGKIGNVREMKHGDFQ